MQSLTRETTNDLRGCHHFAPLRELDSTWASLVQTSDWWAPTQHFYPHWVQFTYLYFHRR